MSKQVDSRVVSMEFDNKRFESNVNTSMSTIDKLKAKLNFGKAAKGFDDISSAAKKVDMHGLAAGVETVTAKFSALDVMGVTALSNITNSVVNAAKNMVHALTVAPVSDGWQEYEMTLNSIQTTMAGTGKTAEEVEKELKKLDEYADKTVYSTSDMLNNLPKFTNAGVELEKATTAMIGIANATALAGGDASKASIAFYNLGQAIGTGYLTRMDYNSINNAGIATMEWKNQMVDAAIAAGTLKKAGEDAYIAGGKTFTLQQLFIDGLQHQWATTDVMMKVFGDYGDAQTEIGKKAYSAAQDIKTFSQMMESLKATAGTGWKDTWQTIFGGLDEAKEFWTGLTNTISGVITKIADIRNKFLDLVLNGNPLSSLLGILDGVNVFKDLGDGADGASKSLEYYQKMFKKIWRGDYKNQPFRFGLLEGEGHDHRVLQDLVDYSDKVMGYGKGWKYTLTMDDVRRSQEKYGIAVKDTADNIEEQKKALESLSDKQLKQAGLTDEQIRLYRELEKESKRTGKSMNQIIEEMTKNTGRDLLIDSFKNIGKMFVGIGKAIKEAFTDIFNPPSMEAMAFALYRIIAAFHSFTEKLVLNEEKMGQLKRTFAGVFAIVRIFTTLLGGGFKIAFKLITQLLAAFNLDILDVTAVVGDALVKFSNWVDKSLDFTKIFQFIAPYIIKAANAIKEWVKSCEPLQKIITYFKDLGNNIADWFNGIKEAENIPKYIIQGLANGIRTGASVVWDAIVSLGTMLIEKFKDVLGIHSPSVIFMALGGFIIAGLALGILKGLPGLGDTIKGGINGIINTLKQIDWGQIFAGIIAIGTLAIGFKLANALEGIASPLEALGDAIEDLSKGAKAWLKSEAMKNIAISLAILAGSLIALSFVPIGKLWNAVGVIAVLGVVLGGLVFVVGKFGDLGSELDSKKSAGNLTKFVLTLIGISTALLLAAFALSKVASLNWDQLWVGLTGIAGVLVAFAGIAAASKLLSADIDKFGIMVLKVSTAMLLLVVVVKMVANMSPEDLVKGVIVVTTFATIIALMSKAMRNGEGGEYVEAFGKAVFKVGAAMLLMLLVAKIAAGMTPKDLLKGVITVTVFGALIVAMMHATKAVTTSANVEYIGGAILKIAGALLLMMVVAKIASKMSIEDLAKGVAAMTVFGGIIVGLMAAMKFLKGTQNVKHIGDAILKISAAMAIIAALAIAMSFLKLKNLAKGIAAIGLVAAMMAGIMYASKFATKNTGALIAITIAIGLLSAAMVALSYLNPKNVLSSAGAMVAVLGALTLLMHSLSGLTKKLDIAKMIKPLGLLLVVVALLGGFMWALSALEVDVPFETMAGLSLVLTTMAGILAGLKYLGKVIKPSDTDDIVQSIIALTAMVIPLGVFASVLSQLNDTDISMDNVLSLSLITVVMTGVLAALMGLSKVLSAMGKGWALLDFAVVIAGLAVLGLILWEFAAILGKSAGSIAKLEGLEKPLLSLAGVMGAMVVVMTAMIPLVALMSVLSPWSYLALAVSIAGLAAMGLVLWEFAGILGKSAGSIKKLDGLEKPLTTLGLVMLAMTGLMTILGAAVAYVTLGIVGALGLAAFGLVLWEFAGILGQSAGSLTKISGLEKPIMSLVGVMYAMTVLLALLGVIAPLISSSVLGMIGLAAFGLVLWEFAAIMGQCSKHLEKIAGLEKALLSVAGVMVALSLAMIPLAIVGASGPAALVGIGLLGVLALALVEFIELLVDSDSIKKLPELGTTLSDFMTNMETFIAGVKTMDDSAITGVRNLAEALLILFAADFLNGLNSWITNDGIVTGLGHFGTELSTFAKNLQPFIENTKNIDPAVMTGIKALAEAILILTGTDIINGLTAWLTGGNSLSQFGEEIGGLGTAFNTFATNIGDFTEAEVKKAKHAADVIKILAEAATTIPNDGGWAGAIFGENSLGTFADSIRKTGTSIQSFATSVSGLSDGSVKKAGYACDIIKSLAKAASEIPNDGGWAGAIFGENSLATFAGNMPKVGTNIATFATNIAGIPDGSDVKAKTAGTIITELANAAQSIPNEGGLWGALFGENSLATFAGKLPSVATNLSKFCGNLGTLDESKLATVRVAADVIHAIADLGKLDLLGKAGSISVFGAALPKFGSNIASFATNASSVSSDSFTSATTKVRNLINLARTIASVNIESLKTFGTSLKKVATDGVNGFVKAFDGEDPKERAKKAGAALVKQVLDGAKSKKKDTKTAFEEVAKAALGKLKSKSLKKDFEGAGKYVVEGFANGIKNNKKLASDAGSSLGKAALKAAKEALDENSPSKEFYKVGNFGGIGFVNALYDNVSSAYKAGGVMADSAKKGLSGAISRITDTLNDEMDMQPTIRPVLDLSDVRSGAGSINSLFSGRTLNINSANVGAVSASMAKRQNGNDNSDIVSGIKALRKDIAGMSNTTYQINGVTYDDGSNISTAVETLVRAAKIERRT